MKRIVALGLAPGKRDLKAYILTDFFDLEAPGTHRFLASCTTEAPGGTGLPCTLWAEFMLE